MKKVLSLCINLLLLIISDVVSLKLIAGESSVVKKDGATHRISKYYVVPNDFDPNNVTNSTEASQATLRMNHSLYSKSTDANTTSEGQLSENRAEAANDQTNENNADVKNIHVDSRSGLSDAQVDVAIEADDNTTKSTGSLDTEQSLDPDDLGNLQVKPITNSITINSSVPIDEINVYNSSEVLQNVTIKELIVNKATQTFERDVEDELGDLILTKFGITVQESSIQNLESFWKLIKLTIDRISDDDELLAKIERLSLLLNIFTNLFEAAQLQKPIESMIDNIIDILQIPFVEKSNTNESQFQTNISGEYDAQCLRKCGQKRSKNHLDSNDTYLSVAESLKASDNLGLENLDLQRRQRGDSDNGDDWVNTSNDPGSNQVTVSNPPTNILRSQLLVPNNLKVIPDVFNVHSSIPTPTLKQVPRDNNVQADPKSNQTIFDSAEIHENLDDQPPIIDPRLGNDRPWTVEDKLTKNLPWTIQTKTSDDLPWHIEDKSTKNLPWTIQSKTSEDLPWHIEDKTTKNLPWTIQTKTTDDLPWHIEDKTTDHQPRLADDWPWTIEDKSTKNLPWTIQIKTNDDLPWHIEDKTKSTKNLPWTIQTKTTDDLPWHIEDKTTDHQPRLADDWPWTIEDKSTKNLPWTIQTKTTDDLPGHIEDKTKSTKNLPWTIQTKMTDDLPWHIEDKTTDHQPRLADDWQWTIEDKSTKNLPWTIQTKTTEDLPWHIEDKMTNHQPWIIEHKTTNSLPWTIKDRGTKKVIGKVENRAAPYWTIENKIGHSPITLYQSRDPSVVRHGGKILLHPNQPMIGTVHSVKHGIKKPYHVYTYVINPATSLYEIPNSGNIVKVKSRQPNANLETKLYGLSTSHGGNKIVYIDKPSPSYYESQFSLSKPRVDISRPRTSQLKHTNHVTSIYDTSNEVNPSDLLSGTTQDNNQPTYLVGHEPETNQKPAFLQPNTHISDSQTNSDEENDGPTVSEADSHNTGPVFTVSASASADNSNVNPDIGDTKPNLYNTDMNLNLVQQTDLHPRLISKASSYSEYTNSPDDYDEPNHVYGGNKYKHPELIYTPSSSSAYTYLPDEYDKPVYKVKTHQHPGSISSSASSNSEYSNVADDYDEPNRFYGGQTHNNPGFISKASAHSEYTNLPNDYNNPKPDYGLNTDRYPGLISKNHHHPEYANVVDDYDEPNRAYGGQIRNYPGFISKASAHSEYTNVPTDYNNPIPDYEQDTDRHPGLISKIPEYGGHTHQNPGLMYSSASSNSEYTNVANDYDEPNRVYDAQTHHYPGFISKASAHSGYTNLPNDYNKPIPDYGLDTGIHPGQISKIHHYPEYANIVDDYHEPIPLYGEQTHKHPGFISEASSHSEFTNVPNNYNNPTLYNDAVHIKTPVNGRPTEIEDNLLGTSHPHGHTVQIIQPSLIAHLHGNQPTGLNYLKHVKRKLAPTYRLFTLDNLLKLHDVVTKTIEVNGDVSDIYDNRSLMNLRKIINIILILAEHLEEPESNIQWYEKIFYSTQKNRHPLEIYVYNLIRQRWLHELMLVLYKNDFNFNILQNPRIFSFLGSWQFPNYVLSFTEAEKHKQHNFNFNAPEVFDKTFSMQHGLQGKFATHTFDDVLEEVPEDLENYVTNHVIDSYKTPNSGIVLSIAGVEAEPDANAIIHILQKYLQYKNFIEKQDNIIIHDNKVEMLNQIILFLREKGYGPSTIADLIRKLYTAVYLTEGKGCQIQNTNFAKNMYDVILPVLRRSGR